MAQTVDITIAMRVKLAIQIEIGGSTATIEVETENPKLPVDELEIRSQAFAVVVRKAIENFVRPAGAPYQPVEKLV